MPPLIISSPKGNHIFYQHRLVLPIFELNISRILEQGPLCLFSLLNKMFVRVIFVACSCSLFIFTVLKYAIVCAN